jgi:hypothetical protein
MSDKVVKLDAAEFFDQLALRQDLEYARTRTLFTKGTLPVRAAESIPLSVAASGTPTPVGGSRNPLQNVGGRLVGYALVEATGTASAEVDFYDGANINGTLFLPITFAPNESVRDWFGPAGIQFTDGLWAQAAAGSVRGVVFIGRVDL